MKSSMEVARQFVERHCVPDQSHVLLASLLSVLIEQDRCDLKSEIIDTIRTTRKLGETL